MGIHILAKYLPEQAVQPCFELIKEHKAHLKIVNERRTRHGDYRKQADGRHLITVNGSLNPYNFLITLIHEIAHLVAFKTYGLRIKPHGIEWKHSFQQLMIPFIRPEIFPQALLPIIANHFRNPSASSDTDAHLALALKQYNQKERDHQYVHEIANGTLFRLKDGRIFKKIGLRVKRYECLEMATGRRFVFHANAEVEALPDSK